METWCLWNEKRKSKKERERKGEREKYRDKNVNYNLIFDSIEINVKPLFSTGIWLHFIIAITDSATLGNSIKPDDERSVFNGNMRTAVGRTSLPLNKVTNWSSVKLGGVLKKCRICNKWLYLMSVI